MRKILLASTAIAALTMGPLYAQDAPLTPSNAPAADAATQTQQQAPDEQTPAEGATTEDEGFGTAAGATTGAIAGAVVGGPIGAVVGGFAGAVLGDATAVPDPAVEYVVSNPVDYVTIDGGVSAGTVVPEAVTLNPIPDYPEYAYVYSDGRPVIVQMDSREIVYSPGYVVPEQTVTYVESNPLDPVTIEGEIAAGTVLPQDVEIVDIPSNPAYAYVYTESGPVLVNRGSRTVVWTR